MKRLAALLMCPSLVLAASTYDFTNNKSQFELLESSVKAEVTKNDFVIFAIWEATIDGMSRRLLIRTSNCFTPTGTITIQNEVSTEQWTWSMDGRRNYDTLAVSSCLAYLDWLAKQPAKPKEKAKK